MLATEMDDILAFGRKTLLIDERLKETVKIYGAGTMNDDNCNSDTQLRILENGFNSRTKTTHH
jgi:hypothetical protein